MSEFDIPDSEKLMGELPPLSREEMDLIVSDLEKSGHVDEATSLLDFWQESRRTREENVRRYLGYMGM